MAVEASNTVKADRNDFFITAFFSGVYFNSNAPSNTIKIKPSVPRVGKMAAKLNVGKLKYPIACCIPIPNSINSITEGILVLPAIISNRYENMTRPLNIISVVYDVMFFKRLFITMNRPL